MAREYVDSSAIRWFDHHGENGALDIEYVGGHVYRYTGVPSEVVTALRIAIPRASSSITS